MCNLCPICKGSKRGPRSPRLGRSKVVETRRKPCHITFRGKALRNVTITRMRECLKCRFRWKTMEILVYSKRPNTGSWGGKRGR